MSSTLAGITYARRGAGEPLLLLHGLGSRHQVWDPVVDLLARDFDLIAIDLPGFGDSPKRPGQMNVSAYADALVAVCAELRVERPHVAGNSLGGALALELGRRGHARSVVAFSPIGFWRTPGRIWCQTSLSGLRGLGRSVGLFLPALVDWSVTRQLLLAPVIGRPGRVAPASALADARGLIGAAGFREARGSFRGHAFADGLGDLRGLDELPVAVAWGDRDLILPFAPQSGRAKRALPDARHVRLRGCGHVPFSDDPAACARIVHDTARLADKPTEIESECVR